MLAIPTHSNLPDPQHLTIPTSALSIVPTYAGSGLMTEAADLKATTTELRALLAERPKLEALISDELAELKAKYGTPRRTNHPTPHRPPP